MKVLGNLDLNQKQLRNFALEPVTDFPATAGAGQIIFKDKRVMICAEIVSGVNVWVPLTREIDTYIHTQPSAQTTWTITHSLNSAAVMVQVYDVDNKYVIPDSIDTSVKNQVTITFGVATSGRAIIMLGTSYGYGHPDTGYEESFTNSDTWVVNHGLGYNPIIRVYIGNQEVQPQSIVHNSTTQTTITFSSPQSGTVVAI